MKKILLGSTLLLTVQASVSFAAITADVSGLPYKLAQSGAGGVYAAVKDVANNALYVSGSFTGIGVDSGGGAMFDANGAAVNEKVKYDGMVYSSLSDTHGGFYVAGSFTAVDGDKEAKYLAHINADGHVDASFKPHMPERIYKIALVGNKLYAESSKFRTIYQVNTDSGQINPSFHVSTNRPIQSMVATHHGLYIGGGFYQVNNFHRGNFAKLDLDTGDLVKRYYKSNKAVTNIVNAQDDKLYINTKDGKLIKIDEVSGVRDQAFTSSVGTPMHMVVDHDWIWAGYRFSPYLKRFSTFDGSHDTNVKSPINAMPRDFAFDNQFIYIAGAFENVAGNAKVNRIARFNKDTLAVDASFHPMIDGGAALTLSLNNGKVFTGGFFNTAYGIEQPYLMKLDATTGKPDLTFRPALDGYPYAMALHNDELYIGGNFKTVDGSSMPKMAKISKLTGGLLPTGFAMQPNWPIYTLKVHGDYLYAGGMFNTIAGSAATPYLARFNLTTDTFDSNFSLSGLNNRVFDMDFDGDALYVAGKFTAKLAKYDVTTGVMDISFKPFTEASQINGVAIYNGAVYAAVHRHDGIEKFDKLTGERSFNTPHLGRYGYGLTKQNNLLLVSSYGAVTCIDMDADTVVPQLTFVTNQRVHQVISFGDSQFFVAGQYTLINNKNVSYLSRVVYSDL
ncbi:MAG: hypothetical protein P1U34_02790 [Coxiellaceae bacterium]|nr:hypothetical protein [Coxiellaceae bacterium]